MCLQCDGYSYEQAMQSVDLTIRTFGWQLTQIDDPVPWSYTIGLLESYDHPELVIVGIEPAIQASVLRSLVDVVTHGHRLDDAVLQSMGGRFVEIHRHHLAGAWFGTWANHYGHLPGPGDFLQVVPPPDCFCEAHRISVPRLDRPSPRVGKRASRRGGRSRGTRGGGGR